MGLLQGWRGGPELVYTSLVLGCVRQAVDK